MGQNKTLGQNNMEFIFDRGKIIVTPVTTMYFVIGRPRKQKVCNYHSHLAMQ